MSIFRETYRDFAENTSIHGLKYTVFKKLTLLEKTFWFAVVLLGFLGSAYMTMLFWARFTSNPTRTSILTDYAPTSAFPFPAVTFCNVNRILSSKVEKFISSLDLFDEDVNVIRRAFSQLLAYTNPGWVEYNITELAVLQRTLKRNDIDDPYLVSRKIAQNCKEMLVGCAWEGDIVECDGIFRESYTKDGLCCSFNYNYKTNRMPRHTVYTEMDRGLSVMLNPMVQPTQNSVFNSVGMIVNIHRSKEYPGDGNIKKVICLGRQTILGLSSTKVVCDDDVKSLAIDHRKCVFPGEQTLKYFAKYSDSNCELECTALKMFKKCGCVPYYYDFTDKPICDFSKIPCLAEYSDEEDPCDCKPDCEEFYYDVLSMSTVSVRGEFETSSFLQYLNVSVEDHVYVNVYFLKPTQTILQREALTSTLYLLASIGGVYSLFVGCSFITCIEIVYYATLRLYVAMKLSMAGKKKRVRPKVNLKKKKNNTTVGWVNGGDYFLD